MKMAENNMKDTLSVMHDHNNHRHTYVLTANESERIVIYLHHHHHSVVYRCSKLPEYRRKSHHLDNNNER